MKQWKQRNKRILSDDELIDSILRPAEYREKLKNEREVAAKAAIDVKPDYSQNGDMEPAEIKKVKFEYKPQDYSRGRDLMSEDEIIDSVLNPTHKVSHKRQALPDLRTNVSPEVKEQWRNKIAPNTKSTKKGITV